MSSVVLGQSGPSVPGYTDVYDQYSSNDAIEAGVKSVRQKQEPCVVVMEGTTRTGEAMPPRLESQLD